jgi:PAS domain S-box-containing protein
VSLQEVERVREKLASMPDAVGLLINVFVHVPVGLAVWKIDGTTLFTNKAFVDLFLVEPPPAYNILENEVLAARGMHPLFERAVRGERVQVPTFWYDPGEYVATMDRRRVAISATFFPIQTAEGIVDYVAATFNDETVAIDNARLLAELEGRVALLHRSDARFRRLSEAGIIGIITADIHGNIREANDAFLAMVGYTAADVLSGALRWAELTPPEWGVYDDRAIAQLAATGIAVPWEKEYLRKDGTRVPVLVGVALIDDVSGDGVAFVLDLTDRKRAELAMRESEARRAAVMQAALDCIVVMDHDGQITDFNPAAERTFGYSRDEAIGQPLGDLLVPDSLRDKHRAGLARYLATGEGPIVGKRIEVPARRKDGTEFAAEVAVLRIASAGPPMFTGYIRDITERRRAAEAEMYRTARDAAEEANAELEAFSYSVAHDLRVPLRAINAFSASLREDWNDKLDVRSREDLNRIIASGERMAQLIEALLDLSRLSRTPMRWERVDFAEIATEIVAQLRTIEPSRVVELVVSSDLVVRGDPRLLRVAIENLVRNAWKFTRDRSDSRIQLGRTDVEGVATYFVRDNGAGFDMARAEKLFVPFQRLHSADRFEGTGIGLATVQRIVRRHGGRIWAVAAENQGATFHFTIR